MSIFSTFKGITIVDSHWHRRVHLFFGIIILFYVYGHDEPLAYLSQIHYSIEGHYSSSFDHLSNNIILPPEMQKVPQPQRAAIAFHDGGTLILFHYTRLCGNTLCATTRKTKGRCIQGVPHCPSLVGRPKFVG
jgi:hypothetical protein